jgi:hypothetical protein
VIDTDVFAGACQLSVALRETTETATSASLGAVESYSRSTDADPRLPAASTQPPEIVAFALSGPAYETGAVHELIPDPPSAPTNVTVTGCEYQPFESGARESFAVAVGAVVS